MRSALLLAAVLTALFVALRYPYAGVLLWTWFTCMQPHEEAYGLAGVVPLNLIIALVTIGAWLISKERKLPPIDTNLMLTLGFLVWMTINSFFAVDPASSWPLWDRTWKTILLGIFISMTASSRVRIHTLIWMVVISLFYYGIKGGIFTIVTGGHNHVLGPQNSMIGDNNQLAVAILMVLPLANYLRLYTADRRISTALLGGIGLCTLAVIGTYSRGAFIALGGLGLVAWWRSRNKILYPVAIALVVVPAFYFMPQEYWDRLKTMESTDSDASLQGNVTAWDDASFQGRVTAWHVAWDAASDHFPFGVGFAGAERPEIFNHYFPGATTHAAHSIYFEVLGDTGFAGLALYLGILIVAFWNARKIRAATRNQPDLSWARDLAGMIQLTLFVFCLGGAALSLSYYDVFFICTGLLSATRAMISDVAIRKPFGMISSPASVVSPSVIP